MNVTNETEKNLKILVVDDHRLFRESLIYVLQEINTGVIVTEASSPSEAASIVELDSNWDLILFDLGFPYEPIWGSLSVIKRSHPDLCVAILSGSYDSDSMKTAAQLGVNGYISKNSSVHELVTSIKNILAGQCSVSRDVRDMYSASIAVEEFGSKQILTKRQREVVELLSAGLCNKLIANKLDISESTTKQHVSFAIHALGARNRTDAVIKAQHLGLIPAIAHAGLAGAIAR